MRETRERDRQICTEAEENSNEEPFFSIVIPVHNVENYLDQCLRSVQQQACFEVLLINDGSTDRSPEICRSYTEKDERFHLYEQKNHGLSYSRNRGIYHAKGKYLLFLDSDDWVLPGCLCGLKKDLIEEEMPDYLMTGIQSVYEDGTLVIHDQNMGEYFHRASGKREREAVGKGIIRKRKTAIQWLCRDSDFCGSAQRLIVKTELVKQKKLFFYNGLTHEDIGWVPLVAASAETAGYSERKWYCYRRGRKGSITEKKDAENIRDYVEVVRLVRKSFPLQNLPEDEQWIIKESLSEGLCYEVSLSTKLPSKDRKQIGHLLDENAVLLKDVTKPQQRVFVMVGRRIGYSKALTLLAAIRR